MKRTLAVILLCCLPLGAEPVSFTVRSEPSRALVYGPDGYLGLSGSVVSMSGPTRSLTLMRDGYQPRTVSDPDLMTKIRDVGAQYPPATEPPLALTPLHWYVPWATFVRDHPLLDAALTIAAALGLGAGLRLAQRLRRQETLERLAAESDTGEGSLVMQVLGGYRLIEVLGEGGMGVVYRAISNDSLDRGDTCACKVIGRRHSQDPDFRQRFQREIKVFRDLRHPNIVQLLAFGEEEGRIFLVMEEVKGRDLSHQIPPQGLPPRRVADIMEQVFRGVEYAHERGIVHRDLKPENIMLAESGQVKLMDFGLARKVESDTQLTRSGTAVGTPAYMAPEQISGGLIDERADQYALGIIAYKLLTGRLPFQSDDLIVMMHKHMSEPPPALPEPHPPERTVVIQKMMAKDPFHRFPSVARARQAFMEAMC